MAFCVTIGHSFGTKLACYLSITIISSYPELNFRAYQWRLISLSSVFISFIKIFETKMIFIKWGWTTKTLRMWKSVDVGRKIASIICSMNVEPRKFASYYIEDFFHSCSRLAVAAGRNEVAVSSMYVWQWTSQKKLWVMWRGKTGW